MMYEMKNLFSSSEQGERSLTVPVTVAVAAECLDLSCPTAVVTAEADKDGAMVSSSFPHSVGTTWLEDSHKEAGGCSLGTAWPVFYKGNDLQSLALFCVRKFPSISFPYT